MNKMTSAAAVLVVGMLLAGMLLIPAGTVSASASSLKVGDQWAMGKEVDYGSNITANENQLNDLLRSQVNMTIDKLKVDSKVAYYVLFEVTGETETTYSVTAKMAVRFATSANVEVTGSMPVAGSYSASDNPFAPSSTVNKVTKTMTVSLDEKLGMVLSATAIVEKASRAITNMTWTYKGAASVELDGKNIPDVNTSDGVQRISYKNYDVGMEMVAGMNLYMDFTPALDLLQMPVKQGETWYTNASTATVSGSINGHIDAHGLTDDQKALIFTEELANATGATDFPIDLRNLNTTDGKISNGQFGPYEYKVDPMKMRCLYGYIVRNVDDVDKQYMIIQVNDGAKFLYSPDAALMSGMYLSLDDTQIPDLPEGTDYIMTILGNQVNLEPVDAQTASNNIASIESYTNKLTSDVDDSGFNISDFFFKAPFLGTFFGIIAVISVGVIVFFAVRPRKP
ncbi:MAG: hypothetical protein SA339_10085 [Methanomassiliicoccus sp.]|nr:hypothetical protein [Methanomassiliicoccus sp.]